MNINTSMRDINAEAMVTKVTTTRGTTMGTEATTTNTSTSMVPSKMKKIVSVTKVWECKLPSSTRCVRLSLFSRYDHERRAHLQLPRHLPPWLPQRLLGGCQRMERLAPLRPHLHLHLRHRHHTLDLPRAQKFILSHDGVYPFLH
jgi:hypothetical protein